MKIQRFEGVEGYGDRTLHMGGYSEKRRTYRNIKLFFLSLVMLCLLAALETTWLSKIPLWILPSGRPYLCLLFVLAAGYVFGEREGCVCGLMGGIVTECVTMEPLFGGIMVFPLVYCGLGYLSGVLSKKILAGNLPSFIVYGGVGYLMDGCFRLALTLLKTGGVPPVAYIMGSFLPALVLTILFSPIVYLTARAGSKIFDRK